MLALREEVLDLGGEVEREGGKFRVQRPCHRERMTGAVEEVGITERDVGGAGGHLLADVGQDDVARDDEEASAVHGRDRTVAAAVLAAAAGLDVADQMRGVLAIEVRVLFQGRQRGARRQGPSRHAAHPGGARRSARRSGRRSRRARRDSRRARATRRRRRRAAPCAWAPPRRPVARAGPCPRRRARRTGPSRRAGSPRARETPPATPPTAAGARARSRRRGGSRRGRSWTQSTSRPVLWLSAIPTRGGRSRCRPRSRSVPTAPTWWKATSS